MRLFYVQDDDCPMWVVAKDWSEAVKRWRVGIVDLYCEPGSSEEDVEDYVNAEPQDVQFVCDDEDLLLPKPSEESDSCSKIISEQATLIEELRARLKECEVGE